MQRLAEAAAFAVEQFAHVERKGNGVPYVTHLFAVAALVGEYGGDEDQMVAALLHDWLEDIDGASLDELRRRFGQRVAKIVLACSDALDRPKPPWRPRKEKHLEHLRTQDADVKLVACADKLHNSRCLLRDAERRGDAAYAMFNADKASVLWYYRTNVAVLGEGWSSPMLDELREVVDALHALR